MKNTLKKIGALVLVVVMMLSLSVVAFADDAEGGNTSPDGIAGNSNGVWTTKDTPVAQGNTVTLYKEITAYNPEDNQTINAPTITYTYSISPVTVAENTTEIYDAKGNHAPEANAHAYVKTGLGTPAITTSLDGTTFTTAGAADANKLKITPDVQMTANNEGYANKYKINITFNPAVFTGAGVYRYVISETAATYETSGVVDGGISATRYLDVYVRDAATPGQYEIYGYVCFTNNNSIDARDGAATNTVANAGKTEGFVAVDLNNDGDKDDENESADRYYTYNVTIQKTLENDFAKNSNKFPFKVNFANTTVTDPVLPIVAEVTSGKATVPTGFAAGAISSFVFDGTTTGADAGKSNLAIAHEGQVKITGIPAGTTVTIDEYNNVTGTVYTTKTSGGTTNEAEGISLVWNAWASADTTNWTTVTTLTKTANTNEKAEQNYTVIFTNKLLEISPTGVVLRVAPYALMLAAGLFIMMVSYKRREPEEA